MQLLEVDDVAERLNTHPQTIRFWLREGRLRGIKLAGGRKWRVPLNEVERQLESIEKVVTEPLSAARGRF